MHVSSDVPYADRIRLGVGSTRELLCLQHGMEKKEGKKMVDSLQCKNSKKDRGDPFHRMHEAPIEDMVPAQKSPWIIREVGLQAFQSSNR